MILKKIVYFRAIWLHYNKLFMHIFERKQTRVCLKLACGQKIELLEEAFSPIKKKYLIGTSVLHSIKHYS